MTKSSFAAIVAVTLLGVWHLTAGCREQPVPPASPQRPADQAAQEPDDSQGWTLDDASCRKLARLRGLVSRGGRANLARKLELLASVHFLIDRRQVFGRSPAKIAAALRKSGKDFGAEDVSGALGELRRHGIIR